MHRYIRFLIFCAIVPLISQNFAHAQLLGGDDETTVAGETTTDGGSIFDAIGDLFGGGDDETTTSGSETTTEDETIFDVIGGLFGGGDDETTTSGSETTTEDETLFDVIGGLFGGDDDDTTDETTTEADTIFDIINDLLADDVTTEEAENPYPDLVQAAEVSSKFSIEVLNALLMPWESVPAIGPYIANIIRLNEESIKVLDAFYDQNPRETSRISANSIAKFQEDLAEIVKDDPIQGPIWGDQAEIVAKLLRLSSNGVESVLSGDIVQYTLGLLDAAILLENEGIKLAPNLPFNLNLLNLG